MLSDWVGRTVSGHCNGFLGDDLDFSERVIEAAGEDWIVVRNQTTGRPEFGDFGGWGDMELHLTAWAFGLSPEDLEYIRGIDQ